MNKNKKRIVYHKVIIRGRKNPVVDSIRVYEDWDSAWNDMGFGVSFCNSVAKYWIESVIVE